MSSKAFREVEIILSAVYEKLLHRFINGDANAVSSIAASVVNDYPSTIV